ncbi:Ribonuclease H-like superfamily protein [Rhynchospora pubera]|uniref:Ribonuclease H-like superfamily protein n=1 Tax=Rhynchospora pubera TaxID=906938 RepID=A0AAV8GHE6_9POAL|nr:Ribonuclease H-like superfamily protein [Rhynchospora pubera]
MASNAHADRLILTHGSSGSFSFKTACRLVRGPHMHVQQHLPHVLKFVWHSPGLLPRVRLFLWKIINNALPIGGTFAAKMGFLSPLCHVCNSGSEIATHALFFCQFARSFWFASPFSVRFESMPDDPTMLLFHVTSILQGFLFTSFANHLWALWKFRCKHICEGAPLIVDPILKMAEYYNRLSRITSNLTIPKPLRHIWTAQAPNLHEGFNCFVDGSFISTGSAGWAYLLLNGENLIQYELQSGESLSAFEAGLKALSLAVKTAILLELNACSFFYRLFSTSANHGWKTGSRNMSMAVL